MENASKALIIAGAILISILIIGLGVYIYGNASSTIKKADLSSTEAQAHNGTFTNYFGDRKSASEVKQLITLIRNNNISASTGEDASTKIGIMYKAKGGSAAITTPAKVTNAIKPGRTYYVGVANDYSDTTDSDPTADGASALQSYYSSGYVRIIVINENDGQTIVSADTDNSEGGGSWKPAK